MKDAYSFDVDKASLHAQLPARCTTRMRASSRAWGSRSARCDADTGAIGGFASHEFQVLADSGEDAIAYAPTSEYAANVEQAEALAPAATRARRPRKRWQKVPTPGQSTCEEVAALLGLPLARTVKCLMVFAQDKRADAARARRPHGQRSEDRQAARHRRRGAGRATRRSSRRPAASRATSARSGMPTDLPLIVDRSVAVMADFVCGANEADFHLRGVNFGRDCREPDLRRRHPQRRRGRPVARRQGHARDPARHRGRARVRARQRLFGGAGRNLSRRRTVSRRSWRWAATGSGSPASSRPPSSRTTTRGASSGRRRWRRSPSPSRRWATIAAKPSAREADRLHDELAAAGVEVLLDDRGERPGVMFADLELIGIPHRITIGDRGLKDGNVEYQGRRDTAATAGARRSEIDCVPARQACASNESHWTIGGRSARCRHFDAGRRARRGCGARARPPASRTRARRRGVSRAVGRRGPRHARSPTSRCRPTTRRAPTSPRGSPRCRGASRTRSPTSASGANFSRPSTTKRPAPASIRSSCSA